MENQQLIAKLREKGYKVTPQRLAICESILSSKNHPTADHIYQEVKKKYPTLSLATIYQTLHLLKEIGLLQELEFSGRISRYDPDTSPHINIICKNCGTIQDYKSESIRELWSQIIRELGFKPIGQRLDIYRYCDQCLANLHNSHTRTNHLLNYKRKQRRRINDFQTS
jgi:Fur family peroxide stress response transcriptional regulator